VRITNAFTCAFDNVVATARTCYSGAGIVRDEQVLGDAQVPPEKKEERRRRRDSLARDLYQAGHHTTLQHAHFQFALDNVSRQFLWSFLHSHPFYNSEQVSQRYVTVKPGHYAVPPLKRQALEIYEGTVARQQQAYEDLCRLLLGPASSAYYARYPARRHYAAKYDREARRAGGPRGDAGRRGFLREFDRDMGGRVSVLADYPAKNEETLARAVREVLGLTRDRLTDDEAIATVMDPARNRYLGEALNLT